MRRLTTAQYHNSIEDVFGPGAVPSASLPSDRETEQFLSIGASLAATSKRGVELYRDAALEAAESVVANKQQHGPLADCAPDGPSDPCIAESIRHFGRRLWRRPLNEEEISRYASIVGAAGDTSEALRMGLKHALAGLMMSPHFLYIPQAGEPAERIDGYRYTSLEMATRLSYFIWNSAPDAELLRAAEAGELTEPARIEEQVRRMMDTERGRSLPVRFVAEAWGVQDLRSTEKDPERYPQWTPEVREAAWKEFRRTLTRMVTEQRNMMDTLLTSREGFANGPLAALYDQTLSGSELQPIDRGDRRAGLLTSVPVMAANSLPQRTSPTLRGVFVRANVLCLPVPPPPEDVQTELESESSGGSDEAQSIRERLEQHRSDPQCASCHELFDPMGMTLENFGPLGQFRTEAGGFPVDPSSEFEGEQLADAVDLAHFLREDERVRDCMAEQFYSFATAHAASSGEEGVVHALADEFKRRGELFTELVVGIATSRGFRYLSREESP
jgi:hypothetical protein